MIHKLLLATFVLSSAVNAAIIVLAANNTCGTNMVVRTHGGCMTCRSFILRLQCAHAPITECTCIEGYLKNGSDKCIPREKCTLEVTTPLPDAECSPKQRKECAKMLKGIPFACHLDVDGNPTCEVTGNPSTTPSPTPSGKCNPAQIKKCEAFGKRLADARVTCEVKDKVATCTVVGKPPQPKPDPVVSCKANEEFKLSVGCESCEQKALNMPCATAPIKKCACKQGYARNAAGDCILQSKCPIRTTCNAIEKQMCAEKNLLLADANYVCVFKNGEAMCEIDGTPFDPTPVLPTTTGIPAVSCKANEEFKLSVGCESCEQKANGSPCATAPIKKCACKQGYARNAAGDCILQSECPVRTTCNAIEKQKCAAKASLIMDVGFKCVFKNGKATCEAFGSPFVTKPVLPTTTQIPTSVRTTCNSIEKMRCEAMNFGLADARYECVFENGDATCEIVTLFPTKPSPKPPVDGETTVPGIRSPIDDIDDVTEECGINEEFRMDPPCFDYCGYQLGDMPCPRTNFMAGCRCKKFFARINGHCVRWESCPQFQDDFDTKKKK